MSNELHEAATRLADELIEGRAAVREVAAVHARLRALAELALEADDPGTAERLKRLARETLEILGPAGE